MKGPAARLWMAAGACLRRDRAQHRGRRLKNRPNTPDAMVTTGPDRLLPNTRIESNIEMSGLARLDGNSRGQVRPVKRSNRPGHGHEISSRC